MAMTQRESFVRSADMREIELSEAATSQILPAESLMRFAPSEFPIGRPVEGTPAKVQISEPAGTERAVGAGVGVGVADGVGVAVGVGVGVGVGVCPRAGRAARTAEAATNRRNERGDVMRVTLGIVATPDARSVPPRLSRKVAGLTCPRRLA